MSKVSPARSWRLAAVAALAVISALSLIPANSYADDPPPLLVDGDTGALTSRLETAIPDLMEKGRVPGLQVALIRGGKIIWHNGFGVRNAESGERVTDYTIFEAASFTKPLFAYGVIMLAEEGVLDLDKPLIGYFTAEEVEDFLGHSIDAEGFHGEWLEVITARHVLSHSGGMPHGEGGDVYPLFFEPGTEYKYSAGGYYWLQLAVAKLTGEPVETTIQKRVLDPLGMTHSCMVWRDDYESVMANGHDMFGRPQGIRRFTEPHAAASLYTTAEDYARFVCAVLNGDLVGVEVVREMLTSQVVVDEDLGLGWSMGFGIQEDANGKAFWQWGDYGIFRNYILAYTEQKLGVVYLTNAFTGLGISLDMVAATIGGQALGMIHLNYRQYDTPLPIFSWAVQEGGAPVVAEMLPKLKEEHPDEFNEDIIGWLGSEFNDAGMTEAGIALLEFNVDAYPESPDVYANLAGAYLGQGDREKARSLFEKTLEQAEADDADEAYDTGRVEWAMEYIEAFDNPVTVPAQHMEKLAGNYGPRHIEFRDGSLWYLRDGTSRTEFTKLTPMSNDMYLMEGVVYFRMKFEYDEEGRPARIVGMYDSGNRDESPRDDG